MIESNLILLQQMYDCYEDFVATQTLACHKGCAHCCTSDVTLTTLEAVYLLDHTPQDDIPALLASLAAASAERFQPGYTTNQAARLAIQNQPLPAEDAPRREGSCTLLAEDVCPVYRRRPFGCRGLISNAPCGPGGEACMEDLWLTVNTVMLQFIEHLDQRGCSGNFADVIRAMADDTLRAGWQRGAIDCRAAHLIANHPLPMLMVPPQHQAAVAPLVERIQALFQAAV